MYQLHVHVIEYTKEAEWSKSINRLDCLIVNLLLWLQPSWPYYQCFGSVFRNCFYRHLVNVGQLVLLWLSFKYFQVVVFFFCTLHQFLFMDKQFVFVYSSFLLLYHCCFISPQFLWALNNWTNVLNKIWMYSWIVVKSCLFKSVGLRMLWTFHWVLNQCVIGTRGPWGCCEPFTGSLNQCVIGTRGPWGCCEPFTGF